MELELDQLQGTKIFVVRGGPPGLARAYGAMFDRQRGRWFFPAYPPFGLLVVADLKRFVPQLAHGKGVSEWIGYLESVPERLRKRETPAIEYATKPFDHQVEGTSFLFHYPRAALFWDAGTGKSKVIVDLLLLLGRPRTIIVTPRVTLFNWIQEIEVHSGGRIRASALAKGPSQKRRAIRESNNIEVLVLSYGTARTMAIPKVQASALRRLKEAIGKGLLSASMAMQLGRTIRKLSDPEEQEAFIGAKLEGAPLSEIEAGVDRAVAGSGPQWLLDLQYDVLVADESHAMSDQGASQTKAMLALSRKAARRYIMSGTPTEGNPLQLYSQMKFLAPCIVPEDWIRYSDLFLVRAKHNRRIVTGFQNLHILRERVSRIAARKTKEECLDLPPRMPPIDIEVELSGEQVKIYNALVEAMGFELRAFFEGAPEGHLRVENAANLLSKLAQVSSGFVLENDDGKELCNGCEKVAACVESNVRPYTLRCEREKKPRTRVRYTKENPKLAALAELLGGLLENPSNKVIVWAVFQAELDSIERMLQGRGFGHVRVDGRTGAKVKDRVDQFTSDPGTRVYLGQIATGVGITLNVASFTIYYSFDWSLRTYLQSIDRNYRAGQTKKVTVYRLLGRGTVDEYKVALLREKRDVSAVLTSKLACVVCRKRQECFANGTELFDPSCIYQGSVRRTIARPEVIEA